MYKAILTALAAAALSGSAVAQQGGQSPSGQQTQSHTFSGSSEVLAGYQISPRQLSSSQLREIQQALEDRGHSSVRLSGEWGPDTEAALKSFQKSQNLISQTGELDVATIMALGLDPLSFGLAGTSETTGQAPPDGTSQQQRMQGTPQQTMPQNGGRQTR